MKLPVKKIAIAALVVIATGSNGAFLALSWQQAQEDAAKSSLTPTAGITTSKVTKIDTSKQGEQLAAAKYAYETLQTSKINNGQGAGKLVLATHQATNAHFALALGPGVSLDGKVADGWSLQQLATDAMWAPGGCSSKPSYLLQGKYIFIDDGKTKPTDKYGSYVLYGLQTGSYVYFGGDNFTEQQANGERIMATANENDQLVFYIDPTDRTGALRNSTTFKHAVGSDQQYIIRRVIDPATLEYKDYKLPFQVPQGTAYYYIDKSYGDSLIRLTPEGGRDTYDGKVANNRIELSKVEQTTPLPYKPGDDETDLERHLNEALTKALPDLAKGQPYANTPYSTSFSLNEVGSNATVNFLVAHYRYGGYETPLVYDSATGNVDPLVTTAILSGGEYVPLGVF